MKLIIQIPCYNEAETLPVTLADLPREVPGFDTVEWLIIDDGSTDDTVAVARTAGVDHVVRLPRNRGLAVGFMAGLDGALRAGADVVVNTDADNQYCAGDIPALVAPILAGTAEIVVGARPISDIEHFSAVKKALQKLGSWAVRVASGTDIPDAPSGFRAMSREAAMRLNVLNGYTYTIETIIQAGQKGMAITSVPIRVNGDLRPSRLVKSIGSYVRRNIATIFRIFMTYRPVPFFAWPATVFMIAGVAVGARFLYYYFTSGGQGHIQSLILGTGLVLLAAMLLLAALLAELTSANRKLLEDVQWRIRMLDIDRHPGDDAVSEQVTVFGAGYVGLVTSVCLAHSGHDVTVIDVDAAKIARLAEGTPTMHEPMLADYLTEGLAAGRLRFRTAGSEDSEPARGVVFVAVGTPPTPAGAADLTAVRAVVESLAESAEHGTLVVMKSTVPPGTGERFAEELAAAGIAYASNPEFLREGSAVSDWYETDRIVVGGEDAACARLAALYADIEAPVVTCDIASAELIKYASNAFLATKISFINEIATLCDLVGADVDLVARGVGMDTRIGTAFLKPGIGWGGSCFPKDTRALDFLATLHGYDFHLLRAVIDVNSRQRLLPVRSLVEHFESLEGRTVAVLGLTFKPDTDDVREAPATEIVALLLAEGARVRAFNPVPVPVPAGAQACGSLADCVAGADAVVLATEWREFAEADWHALAATMAPDGIVFDGRNALDPAAVRSAGLTYVGVGRP